MDPNRIEHDLLGEREVPSDSLSGIHTLRAMENFPLAGRPVRSALIHAFGAVKLACARANRRWKPWPPDVFDAICRACEEMRAGDLDRHIRVDALQGGAGTSTNMNVNEVLANRALEILGERPGRYDLIHPIEDINLHQSTNDAYPTALRVAVIARLHDLEKNLTSLLEDFQKKEKDFAHVVKIGRTEMQDAVLTTLGRTMGAFAEAIARDRWRIFKCVERIRVVNLGGTAIGTGLAAPRQYIFDVVGELKKITGYSLARAENLVEATQNADPFVEVSGMLKACAVNLQKIANDLRFMASGPHAGIGEIRLPGRQAGSSIMPGKINPVIPEAVVQASLVCIANDSLVAQACAMGHLELNPFLPLVAEKLLESIDLLAASSRILGDFCVQGIEADETVCRRHVENSTATVTALVEYLGYEKAQEIAALVAVSGQSLKQIIIEKGYFTEEEFERYVSAEAVTRLGSAVPRAR